MQLSQHDMVSDQHRYLCVNEVPIWGYQYHQTDLLNPNERLGIQKYGNHPQLCHLQYLRTFTVGFSHYYLRIIYYGAQQ